MFPTDIFPLLITEVGDVSNTEISLIQTLIEEVSLHLFNWDSSALRNPQDARAKWSLPFLFPSSILFLNHPYFSFAHYYVSYHL